MNYDNFPRKDDSPDAREIKEARRLSGVQRKTSLKVKHIHGFKEDVQKYLAVKINEVIENMNDKDNQPDDYKGSYNYMIDQLMGLTIEKHTSKRKATVKKNKTKVLVPIKEESSLEEEVQDSELDRFDDILKDTVNSKR